MKVTLSDAERRYIALFEDETGATARDCLTFDDRVVILVAAGEMGQAIGPGGQNVKKVEEKIGRSVELVEDADTSEAFVASALAPAAVRHVTISQQDDRVAYVEVADEDRGVAIGKEGKNIETARTLARRHYDIDDIQLT
ncbi:NusA-like transcription termination signal-binding factor [Halopelagius longus]|uniref:Probable transcription termination protein NusA n=1 Tax=Halopelagius longus TaxID=1236180 RepID=A0A1H1E1B7_9EURY|nr:NusA-like transcription termination signal-binding factor [Halopelagius longus]RDI71553.1 NusA-like transcription termination signal-binding factor [Halopelagius longus]SDQ82279.1 N utilization substance protein A [Halopelagius longus]